MLVDPDKLEITFFKIFAFEFISLAVVFTLLKIL